MESAPATGGASASATRLSQQLVELGYVFERERGRADVAGRRFVGWSGIHWVGPTTLLDADRHRAVRVVHFWDPFAPDGAKSVEVLRQWAAHAKPEQVELIMLAPQSGWSWNRETRTATRQPGRPIEDEANAWFWFLQDINLDLPAGILKSECKPRDAYSFAGRPVTAVVGADGIVAEICEGLEPRKLQRLSAAVAELCRHSKPEASERVKPCP